MCVFFFCILHLKGVILHQLAIIYILNTGQIIVTTYSVAFHLCSVIYFSPVNPLFDLWICYTSFIYDIILFKKCMCIVIF